jgi:hypothetical protein
MSRAAISVMSYGLLLGLASLVCFGVALLGVRIPGAPPHSAEFVAALALAFAAYGYLQVARVESRGVIWLLVCVRYATPILLTTLVALNRTPASVLVFAAPDLVLASWTLMALLADARSARWAARAAVGAHAGGAQ